MLRWFAVAASIQLMSSRSPTVLSPAGSPLRTTGLSLAGLTLSPREDRMKRQTSCGPLSSTKTDSPLTTTRASWCPVSGWNGQSGTMP